MITARGHRRRERLLEATAELVAARGFHAVGIADIGAAAGVSGSAIYRHFTSKDEILVALFDRVVDALLARARDVVAGAASPDVALDALIAAHVDFALRDRSIIAVYDQESHHLPEADRHRLRRNQRAYTDLWVGVLRERRPALTSEAARAAVHATFGLVNSVADYRSELASDELHRLLATMARGALDTVSAPTRSSRRG